MPARDVPRAVRDIDPSRDPRWDAYVAAHPDGVVYHGAGWLRALQREYGRVPVALAVEGRDGALHGVLALMATSGLPFGRGGELAGRRLASLPRTPIAGPLADDRDGLALLVRAARERLPAGARLQLKLAGPWLDGVDPQLQGRPWRLSYSRALPGPGEELRFGAGRNHARIRSNVTRATDAGVTVRPAERIGELRAWHRLYLATMREHLVPARPWGLFAALWEELRPHGEMRLLLAERRGELLAGTLLLMSSSTVFYAFGASRRSALALTPNDVLQWRGLHDAAAEGYARYDLGEVPEGNEGLARFKRKWGAQATRLHRYGLAAADPAPAPAPAPPGDAHAIGEGPVALLARRAWRRVPLGATALAGRIVYRYL
jgi:CelD/BcsL family acetyltransferase involved in cellulose biosynthesis